MRFSDMRRLFTRAPEGALRRLHALLLAAAVFGLQTPVASQARAVPMGDEASSTRSRCGAGAGDCTHQPVEPAGDFSQVRFEEGRTIGVPGSIRTLRAVQVMMAARPEVTLLRIEGHADEVGDATYNLELSKRRVRNVARWLMANGVAKERLELMACGRRYSVQGERTQSAREQNRRVELQVVVPAPSGSTLRDRCDPIGLK